VSQSVSGPRLDPKGAALGRDVDARIRDTVCEIGGCHSFYIDRTRSSPAKEGRCDLAKPEEHGKIVIDPSSPAGELAASAAATAIREAK
jgi:hypothetical protein